MTARLIHRDIKPENILVDRQGKILLGDFGIATVAHRSSSFTTPSQAGTVMYAPPEQMSEGRPRYASDQYALATMIYEWLSGELPFAGENAFAMMLQKLQVDPRPLPTSVIQHLALTQVLYKALARNPKDRYDSVTKFVKALELIWQQVQQHDHNNEDNDYEQAQAIPTETDENSTTLTQPAKRVAGETITFYGGIHVARKRWSFHMMEDM